MGLKIKSSGLSGNKGWRNEPIRHGLARKGIKTGKKTLTKVSAYSGGEGEEFRFEGKDTNLFLQEKEKNDPDRPKFKFDLFDDTKENAPSDKTLLGKFKSLEDSEKFISKK